MSDQFDLAAALERLARIRESLPKLDEAEVMADIDEAVRAVRQQSRRKDGPASQAPIRLEAAEELGGEQPCQAHRFWDLEDE